MHNITFLGDSLTSGYGLTDPMNESVPALIQAKIIKEGFDYKVYNAGFSGSTSGNGLYRLDHWLRRPVDVLVLELGINDFIRKVPVDRTRSNLDTIVRKTVCRNPDCRIVLMGMRLPKSIKSPGADDFNSMYQELAIRHRLKLVPFYLQGVAGKRELNIPDGLHPNAAGYRIIADNVWPYIKSVLD